MHPPDWSLGEEGPPILIADVKRTRLLPVTVWDPGHHRALAGLPLILRPLGTSWFLKVPPSTL
jgi:hypothetical protein